MVVNYGYAWFRKPGLWRERGPAGYLPGIRYFRLVRVYTAVRNKNRRKLLSNKMFGWLGQAFWAMM
jgi:hypothetical protein